MLNFAEVEAWVVVGCEWGKMLDLGLHCPMVTEWELEVGLGLRDWGVYGAGGEVGEGGKEER